MSSETTKPAESTQNVLEAETVLETYVVVAEWIRFADAKAAVTLTVNGVLLGVLIPTLKTYLDDPDAWRPWPWWNSMAIGLFAGWFLFLAVSSIYSFRCILPFRGTGRQMALSHTTHFHPAAVALKYQLGDLEKFVVDSEKLGMVGLKREVLTALLIDAHLSNSKYSFVARSIQCLAVSVVFAVLFLLATLL